MQEEGKSQGEGNGVLLSPNVPSKILISTPGHYHCPIESSQLQGVRNPDWKLTDVVS